MYTISRMKSTGDMKMNADEYYKALNDNLKSFQKDEIDFHTFKRNNSDIWAGAETDGVDQEIREIFRGHRTKELLG